MIPRRSRRSSSSPSCSRIPVVEPQSAVSSSFPRDNPLHAGGELGPLAADADLVVLVGCRSPWYPPSSKPGNATVLVIDEVAHRPHMAYQVLTADHYVGGAAAPTLRAITAGLRAELDARSIDAAAIEARRAERAAAFAESEAAGSPPSTRRSPPPRGRSTRWPSPPRCASWPATTRWSSTRPSRTAGSSPGT